MNEATLTVQTEAKKEIITAFQRAVDGLDLLHMIINGELRDPDPERTMEDYLVRATDYLLFLRGRIEKDDLVHVSTMPLPLTEDNIHDRISRVLHSLTRG